MGGILSIAGPVASLVGGIFGASGGGPQVPQGYQLQNQGLADNSFTSGNQKLASSTVPSALATQNYLYNNPGAPAAWSGSEVAGGLGEMAGLSQFGQGQNLINQGNSLVPYATMALNEGFDPLKSVYGQQFQQNTDQTRALLEARGIDSTPYGAGVEAQSDLNFNNSWQQNLLGRMQAGGATATGLLNQGTGDIMSGANLSGMAPGTYYGGATMPYNTAQTIGTNQFGALSGSQGIQQQPLNNWMSYLGQGNSNTQTAQQGTMDQYQMQQGYGSAIGSGLAGIAKAFGGGGSSYPSYAGMTGTQNIGGYIMPQF